MEQEGTLPRTEEPATGPYPDPDESNPHPNPVALRSILTLSAIYAWVLLVFSSLQALQPKFCTNFI
jgi:hypothetical protein